MRSAPEVRVTRADVGPPVLELLGEHDLANARELHVALAEAAALGQGVVVDLSQTEFLDSSILKLLFEVNERLEVRGQRLALQLEAASIARRVLEITEFPADAIVASREEALARVSTEPAAA